MEKLNKELTELAAKAVGYAILPIEGWTLDSAKGMRLVDVNNVFVRYWNPLTDQADAFDLAVALKAKIEFHDGGVSVYMDGCDQGYFVHIENDPRAAARLAIVRAAAGLGLAMDEYPPEISRNVTQTEDKVLRSAALAAGKVISKGYLEPTRPTPPAAIPYSGADETPPVFARRWNIAADGFGLQLAAEGVYVYFDDAVSVLHASLAQAPLTERKTEALDAQAFRQLVAHRLNLEFGYCLDDAPTVACGHPEDRETWIHRANFPDPRKTARYAIEQAVQALSAATDMPLTA